MSKQLTTGIAVAAALAVVGLFFIYGVSDTNFMNTASPTASAGLIVQDEVVGAGAEAVAGSVVSVQYTGKLENGTVFDTSVGKAPIEFPLGQGYVIPGWEQGIVGMKVGGKRRIVIPPSLGYGAAGAGSTIPPNAHLVFEVELLAVAG